MSAERDDDGRWVDYFDKYIDKEKLRVYLEKLEEEKEEQRKNNHNTQVINKPQPQKQLDLFK